MHITDLEIDGFGAWRGMRMEDLSEGLNVIYGPNEAGKTTLMQFVRTVLYGFSPERRERYLPPVRGGRAGGWLQVATPAGKFRVSRHDEGPGAGGVAGRLSLATADGLPHGEHALPALLSDVDEAVFSNVFAVGLHEIQELGVLNDTAAASLLYRLTAGLDRVSLVEVMDSLDASRRRLINADDKPAEIVRLLTERNKLRQQIDQLSQEARRFAFQTRGFEELDQDIARLEQEKKTWELQSATIEAAISVRDKWLQRRHLDDQITALGEVAPLPADAVRKLDKLDAAIRVRRREKIVLRQEGAKVRGELASHAATLTLLKQAPRVELLAEQQPWIETLESQIAELDAQVAELESDVRQKRKLIGQEEDKKSTVAPLSEKTLVTLRGAAQAVVGAHRRLKEAQAARQRVKQVAGQLEQQIGASLTDTEGNDLGAAIEEAGRQVNILRRRVQIDERLTALHRSHKELQRDSVTLLEREILPPWVLTTLGGMFVAGFVFVLAGMVVPKTALGPFGWTLTIVGALGAAVALVTKWIMESDAARKFDDCQQQQELLKSQIKQVEDERDAVDPQLPAGGGPLVTRLQQAETKLSKLEEMVNVETRRKSARHEADVSTHRLKELAGAVRAARERWRQALVIAGLPADTAPKQLRQLAERQTHTVDAERRLESLRSDRIARQKELTALTARVAQVFADVGMRPTSSHPVAQLQQLRQELSEQQAQVQRRRETTQNLKRIRRRWLRLGRELKRLSDRRRKLLRLARVTDDAEFRRLSLQAARSEQLRRERDALSQDIARLLGPRCAPEAVAEHLDTRHDLPLERRWEEIAARSQATETELKQCYEARGLRKQELKALAEDRRLGERQLELSSVETRLTEAIERWRTLAVTSDVLRDVRRAYEAERQPEALREASDYLRRLTNGHYARIWIPLGEADLRVDDAAGESLSVEVLSRGAREQVYLSLRLALVACYARRGARLPLILDDVLVNFDMQRARAAAEVLRDFAAAGHQLFVFTCHEHIAQIFQTLDVAVRELGGGVLPTIRVAAAPPVVDESPARARRKPRRAPPPEPQPAAIELEPELLEYGEPVQESDAEAVPFEVEKLLRPPAEPRRPLRVDRPAPKPMPEPQLPPPAFDVRDVVPPPPADVRPVRVDRASEEPRRERRPQRLIRQRRRFTWEGPPAMPRSPDQDDWDDVNAA